MSYLGHQLAYRGSRTLRAHKIDVGASAKRNNGKQEHEHAHASYPVRKATPEEHAPIQALYIIKYACTCCREARDSLKECIRERRDLSAYYEGQTAEEA